MPMLAERSEPFDSSDYIYEVKWDGIRCIAYLDSKTMLRSRNNLDITGGYPELEEMHSWVKKTPAVIDGEIVVMKNGKPSFQEWQKRSRTASARLRKMVETNPAIFIAFDVVYAGDEMLFNKKLLDRKEILNDIAGQNANFSVSQHISDNGIDFFRAVCQQELEGVVAKKKDSLYLPGKRVSFWKKFKRTLEEDYIICGYLSLNRRISSLILGAYKENVLVFQGMVGIGISESLTDRLLSNMTPVGEYPFREKIKELKNGIWVKPELVCTVRFLERLAGGLRHPQFVALRNDKKAEECRIEG